MKKLKRKTFLAILAVVSIVIILIVNYNTNYNWRYKDLMKKLTDVPNKEEIKRTVFHSERRFPYTKITIYVSGKKLSEDEIYQMGYDIAEKMDQYVHLEMEKTLSFFLGEITLLVDAPDKNIALTCRRYIENDKPKYYKWIFEKYPSGEMEEKTTPIIYPEGE